MTPDSAGNNNDSSSSTARTVLSLLILVHLFFLGVCLTANLAPSQLQMQILERFNGYTRLLNFDLNFTPYFLTHATEADVDHRIEILPKDKTASDASQWLVLPSGGLRGCDSYKRYQRLASLWAARVEDSSDPALFAQAVSAHFARARNVVPKQIRCRRHFLQSQEEVTGGTANRRNPNDPSFFSTVYAANVLVSSTGFVEVSRIEAVGQVAQPVGQTNRGTGPANNERGR